MTKRIVVAIFISAALVTGSASSVLAHYIYENAKVWEHSDGRCIFNYTETSHGQDGETGGYSAVRNTGYQKDPSQFINCSVQWSRGPKYKRNKWHWLVYKNGEWGLCKYVKWRYNTKTHNQWEIYVSRSRPGCGNAYYGTHGHVQDRINKANGEHDWVGGPIWSGSHYLPAN